MYTLFSTKKVQHMQSNLSRNSPIKYLLRKRQDIYFLHWDCVGRNFASFSKFFTIFPTRFEIGSKILETFSYDASIRNRVNGSNKISRTNHQFITLPGMKVVAVIVLLLTAALVLVALSFLPGGDYSGSVSNSISSIYSKSNCSCGRHCK